MATYFVNKSGNNTTGSSWANAYTTMAACIARPPAAGDTIFVGDDHTENPATSFAWTFPGTVVQAPYFIACVDHTIASPGLADLRQGTATGGSFISTGNTNFIFNGNFYMYGLYILVGSGASGTNPQFNSAGAYTQIFEKCYLGMASTQSVLGMFANAGGAHSRFIDCTFRFGGVNHTINLRQSRFIRCGFDVSTINPINLFTTGSGRNYFEACDFSNCTSATALLVNPGTGQGYQQFKRCKLRNIPLAAASSSATSDAHLTEAIQCDTGAALYRNDRAMNSGLLTTDILAARANGATDSGTPISWKIVTTTTNTSWNGYFYSFPIVVWNDNVTTPVSITVEGFVDPRDFIGLPKNDEIWIDAEYLGTAGNTISKTVTGTKANVLDTAAVVTHTASTADWTAGTVQERVYPMAHQLGSMIKVSSNPGRIFVCTVSGNVTSVLPAGYASAVDGGSVTDGTAVFKAMWRWKQTLTLPAAATYAGYIYVTVKVGKSAVISGCYIDPFVTLS